MLQGEDKQWASRKKRKQHDNLDREDTSTQTTVRVKDSLSPLEILQGSEHECNGVVSVELLKEMYINKPGVLL